MFTLAGSRINPTEERVRFGPFLTERQFVIGVLSEDAEKKGWVRSGYLYQIFDLAGIGETIGLVNRLYFDNKLIIYPDTSESFLLEFRPHYWVANYRIKVWKG